MAARQGKANQHGKEASHALDYTCCFGSIELILQLPLTAAMTVVHRFKVATVRAQATGEFPGAPDGLNSGFRRPCEDWRGTSRRFCEPAPRRCRGKQLRDGEYHRCGKCLNT
jgi:hypothetical protein